MKYIIPVLLTMMIPLHLYAETEKTEASEEPEESEDSQNYFEEGKTSTSAKETGNTEEAKRHFEEGKRLFDDKKFAEAADAFRRAYAERAAWKLLHNIAQAEASARRYGPAIEAFEKYMALGGDEISTSRSEMIIDEMKRLRELLGSFELQGEVPDGAIVQVDGVVRGTIPLTGSIRIGSGVSHEVQVLKDDIVVYERNIRVGGSEHMVLEVNPTSDETPVPQPEAASSRESGVSGKSIFIGLGTGLTIALAGAGVGFALAANSRYDDFAALNERVENGEIPADDPELLKAKSQTTRYDNLTIGMFVGAGVVAAATISLIVIHAVKKNRLEKATPGLSTSRKRFDRFQLTAPGNLIVRF